MLRRPRCVPRFLQEGPWDYPAAFGLSPGSNYEPPARGRSARFARENSFARCLDEAGSVMLHGSAVGNRLRTGRSSSPAAKACGKIPEFEIEGKTIMDCCA